MNKFLNKTKTILATLGTVIISFSSNVIGQLTMLKDEDFYFQTKYGMAPLPEVRGTSNATIKIIQICIITIVFIVGIINLMRIKKIDDKNLKKKKIRNTIIIITVLVLLLIVTFIIPARLLTK